MSNIIKLEDIAYDIKEFVRRRDVIINRLHTQGVIFYGVNINLPEYWNKGSELFVTNRNGGPMTSEEAWQDFRENGIKKLQSGLKDIDLIDMVYIVIEGHENSKDKRMLGYPHIHMLLGVRSLIGKNENLRGEILNIFLNYCNSDVDINELETERDISNYWNYITKKANFKKGGLGKEAFRNHYMYIYRYDSEIYGDFLDMALMRENRLPYGHLTNIAEWHRHNDITDMVKVGNDGKYILINLWRVFMKKLEIFNYNGNLYQRNFETKYSYNLLGDLSILRNRTNDILTKLKEFFNMQLKFVDTDYLLSKYFDQALIVVYNNPQILPTRKIMFNLIEFSDGIYNITVDMFLKYSDVRHKDILKELDGRLTCVKYYKIDYGHVRKPEYWLEKIGEQLGSREKVEEFCTSFGRLFHTLPPPFEIPKKNAVMVIGESNTGKTALLADVLLEMFGKENVGILGQDSSFAFEQLENKVVLVNDEFKYNPRTRSNSLKLLEQKPFLLNSKYRRQREAVIEAPALFLSNEKENDVLLQDDAFLNRIAIYSFLHKIPDAKIDLQLQKRIKQELPKIVVYCNRLFVKKYYVAKRIRVANRGKKVLEKIKGLFLPKN